MYDEDDPSQENLARWLPKEDPRAIEINEVLRQLGSMASHPGNMRTFSAKLEQGNHVALRDALDALATDVHRQQAHPFAYDGDLLLHHAFQAAMILKHAKGGSEEWLASYGVGYDDDE